MNLESVKAFRWFHLDWRAKAFAFALFDRMPFGNEVYFQVQRRVTRTLPRELTPTSVTARRFVEHADVLRQHAGARGLGGLSILEFGAGWDLYGNLTGWCLGFERQSVFDLTRWARPDQINFVLAHLRSDPPAGAIRTPQVMLPTSGPFEPTLKQAYGIDYFAPADAGATGRPDGSFDAVVTTSVLEHIPPAQIARILTECHRLLPPGAIMSHVIDYSDHYAHSDAAITPYNFLAFEAPDWRRFNPDIHFQNRMRHADYAALFEAAGFRVLSAAFEQPDNPQALLARVNLSTEFAGRTQAELAPLLGHYVVERI